MRTFRFLASVAGIADGKALAADARRAEAMGIDVLVIPDHLIEQLAPVPTMATVAAATETLRVGTFVINVAVAGAIAGVLLAVRLPGASRTKAGVPAPDAATA